GVAGGRRWGRGAGPARERGFHRSRRRPGSACAEPLVRAAQLHSGLLDEFRRDRHRHRGGDLRVDGFVTAFATMADFTAPRELMNPEAHPTPERSGAFGGFIGPRTLVSLVENALPGLLTPAFEERVGAPRSGSLYQLAAGPYGWWRVLRAAERLSPSDDPTPAQRTEYFALCLAAHFASAASFVPTDVDSKIRRALWQDGVGTPELARMRALALGLADWDVAAVSARQVNVESFRIGSGPHGGGASG